MEKNTNLTLDNFRKSIVMLLDKNKNCPDWLTDWVETCDDNFFEYLQRLDVDLEKIKKMGWAGFMLLTDDFMK